MDILGCSIELITKNNIQYIKKTTYDKNYIHRLKLQSNKQQKFKNTINKSQTYFNTPNIISTQETEDYYSIIMEYINGQSCIEYFEQSNDISVNNFISEIINFINFELKNSQLLDVTKLVIDKFNNTIFNIRKNELLVNDKDINELITFYEKYIFNSDLKCIIPVGICHGDMTLSNMIFNNKEVYLIDFLDSFVETPLMDIVKLRQDTKYNWSYLLINNKNNLVFENSKSNFYKIDCEITDYYFQQQFYKDNYLTFQILNFLRIFQYVKKDYIIKYLKMVLKDLQKELNI